MIVLVHLRFLEGVENDKLLSTRMFVVLGSNMAHQGVRSISTGQGMPDCQLALGSPSSLRGHEARPAFADQVAITTIVCITVSVA